MTDTLTHEDLWKSALGIVESDGTTEGWTLIEEASRHTLALRALARAATNSSRAMLRGIWDVYQRDLYYYAGEYNELREYLEGEIVNQADMSEDYIQDMGLFCTKIFAWLRVNEVVAPEGETITPEMLIGATKMITKLKLIVYVFGDERTTNDQRIELIQAIWTMTVAGVKKVVADMRKENESEADEDGNNVNRMRGMKSFQSDGSVVFTIFAINSTDEMYIEVQLGERVEFEVEEG